MFLSKGTIYNTLKIIHTELEKVENFFKEQLAKSKITHATKREIRNVKIKSKIQVAFRNNLGNEIYCRVRGISPQ